MQARVATSQSTSKVLAFAATGKSVPLQPFPFISFYFLSAYFVRHFNSHKTQERMNDVVRHHNTSQLVIQRTIQMLQL